MTHFAIPGDESPPLEAGLDPLFGGDDMAFADGIEPLGLSLVTKELTFTLVIFALAAGYDAASWWSR